MAEFEVESLNAFEKMMSGQGAPMDADTQKQMDELMKGYHDLVEFGRREIYKLENCHRVRARGSRRRLEAGGAGGENVV